MAAAVTTRRLRKVFDDVVAVAELDLEIESGTVFGLLGSNGAGKSTTFLLVTGRHLYQFNAGTMTNRTGNSTLRPRDTLDVSPTDATRLSVAEGDMVLVESRHGEARLPVRIDPSVRPGELFATFHTPESFVNRVIGVGRDPMTHTPEYKRTAVRIRREP